MEALREAKIFQSKIPGYREVVEGVHKVDEFIALVADMRDSTRHLMCAISNPITNLQRVYYETSVLLPCLAHVVASEKGAVTEYLGDGVLALYKGSPELENSIYAAHRSAKNMLLALSDVINPLLYNRYGLPSLSIGIGIAYSKAVVTLVGLEDSQQPKVFGECVFRASKLADGVNTIVVDEVIHGKWPTSKGGTLKFKQYKSRKSGVDGYEIGY